MTDDYTNAIMNTKYIQQRLYEETINFSQTPNLLVHVLSVRFHRSFSTGFLRKSILRLGYSPDKTMGGLVVFYIFCFPKEEIILL